MSCFEKRIEFNTTNGATIAIIIKYLKLLEQNEKCTVTNVIIDETHIIEEDNKK